jgi:hypothetical protein
MGRAILRAVSRSFRDVNFFHLDNFSSRSDLSPFVCIVALSLPFAIMK